MADTVFNPSWSGYLSLKSTAQVDIPMLTGSGFARNSGYITPMLAQGSAGNAFSVNNIPLRKTSALSVSTYGFTTFINPTFLAAAFGFTRGSDGDFALHDIKYVPYNGAGELDSGKFSGLHLDCAADGPLNVSMGMLGLGKTMNTASFTAYTAVAGTPLYFKDIAVKFGPAGSPAAATLVHSFSLDLSTGAHYVAVFDGYDYASSIDPGITTGAVSVVQRPGATNLIASSASGEFQFSLGTACFLKVQARRVSIGKAIDANGAALVVSNWVLNSLAGSSPVSVAAIEV